MCQRVRAQGNTPDQCLRSVCVCVERGMLKREVRFSQVPPSMDQLTVVGHGGHVAHEHPHHEILEDEVIDEVLLLLARLDRERLRLITLCEHEQFIRARLRESIDHWRLKRLRDLPLAVQRGASRVSQ